MGSARARHVGKQAHAGVQTRVGQRGGHRGLCVLGARVQDNVDSRQAGQFAQGVLQRPFLEVYRDYWRSMAILTRPVLGPGALQGCDHNMVRKDEIGSVKASG